MTRITADKRALVIKLRQTESKLELLAEATGGQAFVLGTAGASSDLRGCWW